MFKVSVSIFRFSINCVKLMIKVSVSSFWFSINCVELTQCIGWGLLPMLEIWLGIYRYISQYTSSIQTNIKQTYCLHNQEYKPVLDKHTACIIWNINQY